MNTSGSRADLNTPGFFRVAAARDRFRLLQNNMVFGNAGCFQRVAHGFGTALRELRVDVGRTGGVGEARQRELRVRMRLRVGRSRVDRRFRVGRQRALAGVEVDAGRQRCLRCCRAVRTAEAGAAPLRRQPRPMPPPRPKPLPRRSLPRLRRPDGCRLPAACRCARRRPASAGECRRCGCPTSYVRT